MLKDAIMLFVQTLRLGNWTSRREIANSRRRASYRDWGNIDVGDTVIAYRDVPELIEHAIQFYKDEVCDVGEITAHSVAIRDRFGDLGWFNKSQYRNGDFIGDFFE